jgi:hypothetical protein
MAQHKIPKFPDTTKVQSFADFVGGLNYRDNPSMIAANQSPELQNVRIRDGTINKRQGYRRVYATSLGAGKINGLYEYKKADGTSTFLIAHGTSLYTQSGSAQPVSIKSGLANVKADFFVMDDKCYMLNGTDYIVYDGTTCADVVGYIPTILTGRSPSGSPNAGTALEKFNLISAGFKTLFSSDGAATVYTIPYTTLDATTTAVTIGGVAKTEGIHYTVNRTTGAFNFAAGTSPHGAPAAGTDNVVITAYKASLSDPNRIKNCTIARVFGGATNATVFFSGNPNYPDLIWHTRLYGDNFSADYFPDDAWQKVPGRVESLSRIYDYLFVSHLFGHGYLAYSEDLNGIPIYPYSEINSEKGIDIPDSVQEVDNSIVCASTQYGVIRVLGTTVRGQLNVSDLSDNTNPNLLLEPNLTGACSYTHDGYYGLCVGSVVYVWDYKLGAWLYDTNIPASCFMVMDATLYFGNNTEGLVYQFADIYNDDGTAIDSYYDTRQEGTKYPYNMKTINTLLVTCKPLKNSTVDIYFITKSKVTQFALQIKATKFTYTDFSYSNFTYLTSDFPFTKKKRIQKKTQYVQVRFRNSTLDQGMSIVNLQLVYDKGSEIR